MTDNFTQQDSIMAEKPSSALNVFTILSIIGNAVFFISSLAGYFTADMNYERNKALVQSGKMNEIPSVFRGMIDLDQLKQMADNKLPIMLIGIICSLLGLAGALQMRKLKLQGYFLWMAGEMLFPVSMIMILGFGFYQGLNLLSLFFPLVFIIIYTVYKKELR